MSQQGLTELLRSATHADIMQGGVGGAGGEGKGRGGAGHSMCQRIGGQRGGGGQGSVQVVCQRVETDPWGGGGGRSWGDRGAPHV